MKLLMVTMSMDIGGAETHILELARGLKKRGIEVHVASAGGVFVKELQNMQIPHHILPLDKRKVLPMLWAQRGLKKLILREKYDIVHAHARIPGFLCGNLRKTMNFRFITTDHLDFELTPLLKKMTNWGEYTFAVSEDLRKYLLNHYSLNPEHISLTVNGVDTEKFSPSADGSGCRNELQAEGKTVLLHISRLDTPVCHCASALMDAMLLLKKNVMLVIVGDGDGAPALREKAAHINADLGYPAIRLVGAKSDVVPYIAASDIVIAPSRAAMEGMSCGKPTILAGSQGYGGIFSEKTQKEAQKSNFCFRGSPLPTADMLANDIQAILAMNEKERAEYGASCREFIKSHYSVDNMVESQLMIYEKLLPYPIGGTLDVLLCGYYGYGNSGDETLLSVIIREIRKRAPSARICVLSAKPKKTAAFHMVDAIGRFDMIKVAQKMKKGSLFLFGGGSLLQDKTSNRSLSYYVHMIHMAKKHGMKIAIFANGIGPILREKNTESVKTALSLADSISFRDVVSLAFCQKHLPKASPQLTFDPAILMEAPKVHPEKESFFVVIPKKSSQKDAETLKNAILWMKKNHAIEPRLLPLFEEQDKAFADQLAEETGAVVLSCSDTASCLELLSRAEFLLSSRLHGLVYATITCCPMLAFSDDIKLSSYMKTIGLEPPPASLEETMAHILKNEEKIRAHLREHLPIWRKMAESEFDSILPFLNKTE